MNEQYSQFILEENKYLKGAVEKLHMENDTVLLLIEFLELLLKTKGIEKVTRLVIKHLSELLGAKRTMLIRKESMEGLYARYIYEDGETKKINLMRTELGKDYFFLYVEKVYVINETPASIVMPIKYIGENIAGMRFELDSLDELEPHKIEILKRYGPICGLVMKNQILLEEVMSEKQVILEKNAIINEEKKIILEQNKKSRRELKLAQKIQKKILPSGYINFGDYTFYRNYKPSYYLGGDFYDVIECNDENSIVFYMADISGHGVGASLLTVFLKQTLKGLVKYYEKKGERLVPSKVLKKLQKRFLDIEMDEEMYIGIFIGVIDIESHTLTISNAGHNVPPMHVKGFERAVGTYEISGLPINGLGLDLFDFDYEDREIYLERGDSFILLTDGAVEERNALGEEMGIERLKSMFVRNKDMSLEEQFKIMLLEMSRHSRKSRFGDDIAFLAIHREY